MRKNRKFKSVRFNQNVVALEVLEQKLLMAVLQPSSNVTPPSTNGWHIVTSDVQLNTSCISSTPGLNYIPSGFTNNSNYTLRQIIGYYDYVYNSTQDWTVNLAGNTTYTLSAYDIGSGASRGEKSNSYGDLDVFAGAYSGMGHLILSAPAGSPATITCDAYNNSQLDRIFNIMSGGSLILENVIITGGLAKDNGSYPNTDAFGGGILVESGGSLTLKSSTITQNYAVGSNAQSVIGLNTTRQGAGYNAAGGGIYGTAGSTITIDSSSVISNNNIRGGKGGRVSSASYNNGTGGAGGNAYGAGVAINVPASGSVQTTSTYPTNLYLQGGASIVNNQINNVSTQSNGTKIYGGTGGSCAGGKGGSGGSAFGAGLFMSSGALNLDGGASKTAVIIQNNSMNYGRGFTSNTTSIANAGSNGLAEGGGTYLSPALVIVSNGTSSGGILNNSNNTANGSASNLYIPTVLSNDTGFTANNGTWTLRTAVAALNPLVATGMNLTLNLPTANISLVSSNSGTNTGSISINNTGAGSLTIIGAGSTSGSSVINGISLANSVFSLSNANVTFTNLTITGANTTGSGGAINQGGGSLTLNNTVLSDNKAGTGGAYYSYGGSLKMVGGGVIGNSAPNGSGAGLFLDGGMKATLNGVSISNNAASNSAGWGGGIFQDAGGSLSILGNSTIRNNTAQVGAGLFITGNLTMNGGSVSNNNATANGGGFYVRKGNLKLANTTVSNNSASGNGGGLNFTSGAVITLSGGGFSGNSAPAGYGGGIYGNGGTLNTSHGLILSNNTASQGGGAYLANGSATFIGGTVQNNNATNGGGLSSNNNNLNLSGVSVLTNHATGSGSTGYGGGLSQTGGGTLNLKQQSRVKNNTANYGGGIYTNGSTANVISSTVKLNSATISGGGIYATVGTKALNLTTAGVSSNSISGSSAASGAGIYASGGTINTKGNFNLIGNSINSNSNGTIQGAGLYGSGTTINFNGGSSVVSMISKNSLTSNGTATGAGIYLTNNAILNQNNSLAVINNNITALNGSNAGNGVGAGLAFSSGAAFNNFTSTNVTIGNGGFETPSEGSGYVSAPANASWTFSGTSGIEGNGSAWNAASAPQGTQAAFLQEKGSISQSITGFTSNQTYVLTFMAAQRSGYPAQSFSVSLDGTVLATYTPRSTAFQSFAVPLVNVSNAPHTIALTGLNPSGTDQTVFIDNLQINSSAFGGNYASGGGNDIAFQVGYTGDNNTTSPSFASGINHFTSSSSTGSLRSAIGYAENWMNNSGTSPTSMAIILSSSTYTITSANWQLVTAVPTGNELTIIGGGSSRSTITTDGGGERVFCVNSGGSLVLQNLIVTGGHTLNSGNGGGGGIYLNPGATLTLNNVSVTGNNAGYNTTAANGANSAGTANGHKANGGNGSNGLSGYGGGIYMAGGTLNLLSNSSVSGNTVYGQNGGNGGNGQQGTASADAYSCGCHDTHRSNGGNGGSGGTGGNALGGGIYQAGGTLNSPSGSSNINGNNAIPGNGGLSGNPGEGGSWSKSKCSHTYTRTSQAGSTPTPDPAPSGTPNYNYDHSGGQTVFTSNSTANAQSTAGLYQSGGSISQATIAAASEPKRLAGVTVELHAEDGKLIAVAKTDVNGRYKFNSEFSGLGYVQLQPIPTFEATDKGSRLPNGVTSAFDSGSLKSDLVTFLHGTVLNDSLNLILNRIDSSLAVRGNTIRLNSKADSNVLWQTQLMPKTYHGGFTVSTFDVNNDSSLDYLLITKTGKPTAFIVDGRTGQPTRIAGTVVPYLRTGFVVLTGNVSGDGDQELILTPSGERSGRISVIDLKAQKVLWNATDFVLGGMKINVVGTQSGAGTEMSDLQLVSIRQVNNHKVLDGATGRLVETVSERLRLQEIRKAEREEHANGGERNESSETNEITASSLVARRSMSSTRVKIPAKKLPVVV